MKIISKRKLLKQKLNKDRKYRINISYHRYLKINKDIEKYFWFGSSRCGKSFSGLMHRFN